jgi:hypothetical protein
MKEPVRLFRLTIVLAASAALILSCSGSPKGPEDAVDKMLKAYGGEKNIPLLTNWEGRGFRKQLPMIHVATNYPIDIFQSGINYKMKAYNIQEGQVGDFQLLILSDDERFGWSRGSGITALPEWEAEMIGYRFPMILVRLSEGDMELEHKESEYWDGLYHIKFVERDNIVDVGIDEESFFVKRVEITSVSDSSFSYREEYSDFVKTDGIWFPNRFRGFFKDKEYFEFLIPVVKFGVDFPEDFFSVTESDTLIAQ